MNEHAEGVGVKSRVDPVMNEHAEGVGVKSRVDPVMNEHAPLTIVVVGIGADGMSGLSDAARNELSCSTVIYGSQRQLDLLDASVTAQRRCWPSPMLPALQSLDERHSGIVHVVASGDPLLHGVGSTLVRRYGIGAVRIVPHVSSVTLACARLGWAVQDTEVISVVTAPAHTAVRRGGQAVVLSRNAETPKQLAALLCETGRGASEFTVLEQLGGARERIRTATAGGWLAGSDCDVDALNLIAVRYLPDDRICQVLPDDRFLHDGNITKRNVRAVTMAALAPRPGELLWDVGSGSGSVAVEWCRSDPGCRAIAFELNGVRAGRIADNSNMFGALVEVYGEAPEAFAGLSSPAAIFVGGGVTKPGLVAACLDHLKTGGRMVVNAVTAESEAVLVEWYSRLGGELRRFQHYRGEPLGRYTGWKPQLPITQWMVTKQ
jgi:precorrin-6Y C5,15-methyltransferase (decarboxylating)